ncbi:MAG: hypothetical protein JNM25_20085 [Planctomycetes bacterium]|nr:hypothetical protein [Planctomycetota bacterium]
MTRHRLPLSALPLWAALSLGATVTLPAQGRDPMHEIQEIARSVDEQLQEIDRLLLESGKQSQARSRPKELLEQASERSTTVEDGIEKLIQKLTEMKNQGGEGSPSDGEPQPGQGQGQQPQPQGSPQNRRENQTPDFVQQPKPDGEQPGQEPKPGEPKPADGQPQGGEQAQDTPENRRGNRPPESETGPAQAGDGDGTWGELQPYVNFLKNRGSSPKVPEKYRKYWEAYLKNKQGSGGR